MLWVLTDTARLRHPSEGCLTWFRGKAGFPTYWKQIFVNVIRVWNLLS